MKSIVINLLVLLMSLQAYSQKEGTIYYKETIKLDIQFDGMDEEMKKMFPSSQSVNKELHFNLTSSLFQNKKGEKREDIDLKSDDGAMHIKLMTEDSEDILYKSFVDNKSFHQKGIFGKSFVATDALKKNKWKLTNEKLSYLGYECQKAVIEEEGNFVIAWYSSQIPVSAGPGQLHGLPGVILMANINDGEREYKATSVELGALEKGSIAIPDEGKQVTEEEFQKIRAEKEKEMEMNSGGRRVVHRIRG